MPLEPFGLNQVATAAQKSKSQLRRKTLPVFEPDAISAVNSENPLGKRWFCHCRCPPGGWACRVAVLLADSNRHPGGSSRAYLLSFAAVRTLARDGISDSF